MAPESGCPLRTRAEAWDGTIIAPGSAGARVDLGGFLRLHDYVGRCTMAAVVEVNRHNQGRGFTLVDPGATAHATVEITGRVRGRSRLAVPGRPSYADQ